MSFGLTGVMHVIKTSPGLTVIVYPEKAEKKGMDVFVPLLLAQRSTDFDRPFHFCIFYTEQ